MSDQQPATEESNGATAPTREASASAGVPPQAALPASGEVASGLRWWWAAYRMEALLFIASFVVLASFSSQRFLRQSGAPHFVYQAKSWLDGHLDIPVRPTGPNGQPDIEDWACVREVNGVKTRCEGMVQPTDKWYSSFPWFPAVVMMPFVAIHGFQFNDTSFGVIVGALAIALFYSLLRKVTQEEGLERTPGDNTVLALVLAFGSVFFYCAIRGEVWFSAEVMGVALTCLYARNAYQAQRPYLAGLFFSMAVLTRTPLLFTGVFFVMEAVCPTVGQRLADVQAFLKTPGPAVRKLGQFAAAAAPLAIVAALYNQLRFGSVTEFGHRFFYNNRVNLDIDTHGLFSVHYLWRNLDAAFLKLPTFAGNPPRLGYDVYGLSLLLTFPLLLLIFWPRHKQRLLVPVWLTIAACALPGLLYQNTGANQFGFRFSLDYTPWMLLAFAAGAWSLKNIAVRALLALGFLVNFWGAVAFSGYTEYIRRW
ncbi:MAG: hypothetical protein K1X64_12990 [Myxococcaceae bacterium]|nr:hypothetical protein [Myxococcaceae bacterium]